MIDNNITYYYFIGIGGIGMSALARYFKSMGKKVYGYDRTKTKLTTQLVGEGMLIHYEDDLSQIPKELTPKNTLVIYTPAVPVNLNEYKYFLKNDFTVKKRSEVLGDITRNTYSIAVAGTHGKTTTSSIIGHILHQSNLESSSFLGGIIENYDSNVILNGNKITVTEADEFDRSFLKLSPSLAVITSVDADHLDVYGEAENLINTFKEFGSKIQEQLFVKKGLPFVNALTYGVECDADFNAVNIQIKNGNFYFDVKTPTELIKNISISLAGRHNIENTTAAIAVAKKLNVSNENIIKALESFKGIKRRFNRWNIKDKVYIDDYAHHPTELNAIFETVKEIYPSKKVLAVFQPHLFSRTKDFADDFAKSLAKIDDLLLLDIYPAREEPIEGITSNWLANKIDLEHKKVCSLTEALNIIKQKDFDVLITVGAGNIDTLVKPIKIWLNEG